MRITLNLDPDLLARARVQARRTERTLSALVADALTDAFARDAEVLRSGPTVLPTSGQGGLLPGVDLDRSTDLLDRMGD